MRCCKDSVIINGPGLDRDKTAVKVTHYDMYCTKREGGERERVQEKKRKRQERRVLEGIERERVAHITNNYVLVSL